MEQLKQLLASNDTSNHLLCYQLCKGQGIDLIDVVKLVFHDKDCWNYLNETVMLLKTIYFRIYLIYDTSESKILLWINGIDNKFKSEKDIFDYIKVLIELYVNNN